jgi:hypothetical protein
MELLISVPDFSLLQSISISYKTFFLKPLCRRESPYFSCEEHIFCLEHAVQIGNVVSAARACA